MPTLNRNSPEVQAIAEAYFSTWIRLSDAIDQTEADCEASASSWQSLFGLGPSEEVLGACANAVATSRAFLEGDRAKRLDDALGSAGLAPVTPELLQEAEAWLAAANRIATVTLQIPALVDEGSTANAVAAAIRQTAEDVREAGAQLGGEGGLIPLLLKVGVAWKLAELLGKLLGRGR